MGVPGGREHQPGVLDVSEPGQPLQDRRLLRHRRKCLAAHNNSHLSIPKILDPSCLQRFYNSNF